jgi:thiol:disulfide interchange protein DsbC
MRILTMLAGLALITSVQAAEVQEFDSAKFQQRLNKSFQDVEVTGVSDSPIPGLLEVELNGRDRVYATDDGGYLFTGDLLEITDSGAESLKERAFQKVRSRGIAAIDEQQMISFTAEDEAAEVYVFTDTSCGYCRKLHQHMGEFNDLGVTVHYLAFPRGGADVPAAKDMEEVWCSEDRQQALTEVKLAGGLSQTPEQCDNPVAEQYQLGLEFGVRGTPAIYTRDGEQLGGYVPPKKLAQQLGL